MHDLASLAVPCLAWTRLRPNKVRARRGAGPGGPRRPAMGSSGAHRFDGAAVTWRSMGWRRRVVGARACHRRCRVIRPKFTDTGTSSALMHARGRGRLGRSSPPSPFRGARPCPRAARGCPPAPARLERVRHHIGGSFKAADHRPQPGILGGSAVGCPLNGREKAWPMEGYYRVPSLFSKRSNQALRPGPPPKPVSN